MAKSGHSVAALAVDGVVQLAHPGDPGAGEGLRGDLLVAHHAQTVPRPSRSRRPAVALAAAATAAAAAAAAALAHSGAYFPHLADGEVGEGGAERGTVGGVEEGVDRGVAPS